MISIDMLMQAEEVYCEYDEYLDELLVTIDGEDYLIDCTSDPEGNLIPFGVDDKSIEFLIRLMKSQS